MLGVKSPRENVQGADCPQTQECCTWKGAGRADSCEQVGAEFMQHLAPTWETGGRPTGPGEGE